MSYRFYNVHDADAPADGAKLPNGAAPVPAFQSYRQLREREIALHRLLCEVVAVHANGGPVPRAHQRLLEDVRDLCRLDGGVTAMELAAAATHPVLQTIAQSGVAHHRTPFYDGVDDIPLDVPAYAAVAGLANIDDGGRMAVVATVAPSSAPTLAAPAPLPAAVGAAPNNATPTAAAAAVATDPSLMYMADLKRMEREVLDLAREAVAGGTTAARRTAALAQLREKRDQLVALREKLTA